MGGRERKRIGWGFLSDDPGCDTRKACGYMSGSPHFCLKRRTAAKSVYAISTFDDVPAALRFNGVLDGFAAALAVAIASLLHVSNSSRASSAALEDMLASEIAMDRSHFNVEFE